VPPLLAQISQASQIPSITHNAVKSEISSITNNWSQTYSEYQSGGWKTLSLYGQSKDPNDTVIRDCSPVPTDLLLTLPKTHAFLNSLGLKIMWARLAMLEPTAFLWEHRDYVELNNVERLRLHVPVLTNSSASLIMGNSRIHVAEGFIWKLNPSERHGACNLGREIRIHIIIDAYGDESLERLIRNESLDPKHVSNLPELSHEESVRILKKATVLARLGYRTSAEACLLKLFHSNKTYEGQAYDFVAKMYESIGYREAAIDWRKRKCKFLGLPFEKTMHA
jgi:hypothetical protein